jgi:prepilin-type N-terminal cleavage/methylation domain-containing protein
MRKPEQLNGRLGRGRGRGRGFTLIETAMATAVIGVAVVAVLNLLAAGTNSNAQGVRTTTAMNLAANVREMCVSKTTEELAALAGTEYSPPRDASGEVLGDYDGWMQRIDVQCVDVDDVDLVVPAGSSPAVRVTVTVRRHGKDICAVGWLSIQAM